jgi:predicted permease
LPASGKNANTIVLSDAAWKEAYGSDPAILGKTVKINNTSYAVVGVMPAGFRFPYRVLPFVGDVPQAWLPLVTLGNFFEPALRQGGQQAGSGSHQNRLRCMLVIAQIAMSFTLLAACGWLLRTIYILRHVPLGFHTDHIIVARLAVPAYKFEHRNITSNFYEPLLERAQHLPGVQTAGLLTWVPLSRGFRITTLLRDAGKSGNERVQAQLQAASPEMQRVLGFRMLRGRFFDAGDTAASGPVVVVNRAFVKIYAPDQQDPGSILGRKILLLGRHAEVIGVLDDEHQDSIMQPSQPEIEACIPQLPLQGSDDGTTAILDGISMDLALRTQSPVSSVIPELRTLLRKSDVELANSDVMTMDQIVADSYGSQRLAAHLLEVFGGAALLLCVAGLYGLLSYIVSQRRHELGVRLALGAPRAGVLWLVLRQAGGLVVAGITLGVVLTLASGRLVRSFLYGVSTHDGWTLGMVAGLLLISALTAAWRPARRAAM